MNLDPDEEAFEGAYCLDIMDYITSVSGQVLPYDMRIFDYDYWPKYDVVSDYFTNSTLATDANMTLYSQLNAVWPYNPKSPVFEMYSEKVAKDLKKDNL